VKLLRTIALDRRHVRFDVAAELGDWAVSGAFRFAIGIPASSRARTVRRSAAAFLGVQSWGWSTLVQIVPATAADRQALVELLAAQLVDRFGAPDLATATACRRRGNRLCGTALHASRRQSDCGPPHGD